MSLAADTIKSSVQPDELRAVIVRVVGSPEPGDIEMLETLRRLFNPRAHRTTVECLAIEALLNARTQNLAPLMGLIDEVSEFWTEKSKRPPWVEKRLLVNQLATMTSVLMRLDSGVRFRDCSVAKFRSDDRLMAVEVLNAAIEMLKKLKVDVEALERAARQDHLAQRRPGT